ncbi:hypothetical protein T11_11977 [Trichinella zimbabwensis]|uniref:Uncharacterized protein n=1 Tax=Trichinella zimbabwensis TaxID=268475 RepID=A0A0V1HJ13_9BILA|nr:hypothetical protein T11_11977 [Trichinella zimbabwensis]
MGNHFRTATNLSAPFLTAYFFRYTEEVVPIEEL